MGKSVDDLALFMSGLCDAGKYRDIPMSKRDHNYIPKPFD